MRLKHLDWSTINKSVLMMRPKATLTHGDHLQNDCGNGCYGDPPGYPTYFTRSVYYSTGNDPFGKWSQVIEYDGERYGISLKDWKGTWEEYSRTRDILLRLMWQQLPLNHPRTVAWIEATFKHHHSCYQIPGNEDGKKNWRDNMLIWPGGTLGKTPFGDLKDVKWEVKYAKEHKDFDKWRPSEQSKFIEGMRVENERISRLCREVATPENHDGTILVRRYYPEFQPNERLISGLFDHPGNWWETMSKRPSPSECPGQYSMEHPCNGSWCQLCGWHEKEK